MVQFLRTWLVVVVVFFVLNLAFGIFSPIVNNTLDTLVDNHIYENQQHSGANGDQSQYYASLYSAKVMIVGFFNLFPFALACILIVYGIMNSLRREQDDYYA